MQSPHKVYKFCFNSSFVFFLRKTFLLLLSIPFFHRWNIPKSCSIQMASNNKLNNLVTWQIARFGAKGHINEKDQSWKSSSAISGWGQVFIKQPSYFMRKD